MIHLYIIMFICAFMPLCVRLRVFMPYCIAAPCSKLATSEQLRPSTAVILCYGVGWKLLHIPWGVFSRLTYMGAYKNFA